jgi:hypothetical protein
MLKKFVGSYLFFKAIVIAAVSLARDGVALVGDVVTVSSGD